MVLWNWKKRCSTDKAARKIVVWTQVELVEQVCALAHQAKGNPAEAGMLGLLHGLALTFDWLELAEESGRLSRDQTLRIKTKLTEFFASDGYHKEPERKQTELFLGCIYDLRTDVRRSWPKEDRALWAAKALAETTGLEVEALANCYRRYLGRVQSFLENTIVQ